MNAYVDQLRARYSVLEARASSLGYRMAEAAGQPQGWYGEIPYVEFLILNAASAPSSAPGGGMIEIDYPDPPTFEQHLDDIATALMRLSP